MARSCFRISRSGAEAVDPRLPPRAHGPRATRHARHAPTQQLAHVHPSLLARRGRQLTAMEEASTPALVLPGACKKRGSQKPARPAASPRTTGAVAGRPKALWGLGHCLEHVRRGTRCDRALTRFVTVTDGAAALPGLVTQCQRPHTGRALWW